MTATLADGIALHRKGELGEAEKVYLEVLARDEDNATALHFLGVLRHQQGQSLQGVDLVRRAISLQPDYVDALNNLGNILQKIGSAVDALAAYRHVLELRPDHPEAMRNLGIALRKVKRFEEAAQAQEQAIAQWPEKVDNYYALANAYKDLARYDQALAALRKALELQPQAEGFWRLGHLLYRMRRNEEAAAAYEAWLRLEPGNPVAEHMLAAFSGKEVPGRARDAFVTQVFDGFAGDFDEVLTRLEYRAPALVGAALQRIEEAPRAALEIMDAGCGTGLLAPHLRPYARRLVGVDLSPKMLEKARSRAAYDRLAAAELTWYLGASPQAFDIIASSDTLVYFGDLREVLGAAAAALRSGGRLVFTLEHAANEDQAAPGYRLNPHGRYSHTEAYARRSLEQAGFEVIGIAKEALRRERGVHVPGLVVAARLANPPQRASAGAAIGDELAFAVAMHRQGELAQAERAYLTVLDTDEASVEALVGLGALREAQGRSLAALNLLRRAVDLGPGHVEAWLHLGGLYRKLGSAASALHAYQRVLELQPEHPAAARELAPLLEEMRRLEQSAAEHLQALAAEYQQMGRIDDALEALKKALVLRPQAQAFRRLGAMLSGLGRVDEAAATYEAWLRAEPGNPIAGHLLAACTGRGVPERGADAYVAAEFDRFADTFDSVLGKLEYRAPALVAAALRRACGEPRGDLDVVDAGCGTGLLAPYLRPYARRLAGVDLSPRMLEKAAARAVYDELRAAELTSYLASSPHAFDLVAASDTLNYFGDLAGVLAAAAGSLRPGGKLVFTLEHAPEEDPVPAGYRIHPDGRYMHSEAYLRKTLAAAGFEAPAIESGVLRREGDAYVRGLVVSARTPQRPEN